VYISSSVPGGSTCNISNVVFGQVQQVAASGVKLQSMIMGLLFVVVVLAYVVIGQFRRRRSRCI